MIFKLAMLVAPMGAMQVVAVTYELGVVPIIVAVIAGIAPLTAVFLSYRKQAVKMQEIHVLVNSRLTEALDEIASLKRTLDRKDAVIGEQASLAKRIAASP
jgi:hypothetical protein